MKLHFYSKDMKKPSPWLIFSFSKYYYLFSNIFSSNNHQPTNHFFLFIYIIKMFPSSFPGLTKSENEILSRVSREQEDCTIRRQVEFKRKLEKAMRDMRCKSAPPSSHTFITISLDPSLTTPQLHELVVKLQRSSISYLKRNMMFCIEFFGEDYHPHIHILCKAILDKSRVIRDCSRLFKCKKNFVDVLSGRSGEALASRRNYILGQKQDNDKLAKVSKDREFREKNNFSHVYYKNAEVFETRSRSLSPDTVRTESTLCGRSEDLSQEAQSSPLKSGPKGSSQTRTDSLVHA